MAFKKITIVCPSRDRAESMTTNVNNMVLCVDEKEKEAYKNKGFEIITHPSLNNLSKIRQFIYKKFDNVFFIDDDIASIERVYQTKENKLNPVEAEQLILKTGWQAAQIGATLYGFNNDPSPTHYNQHKPFMLNGYINGCAMGLLKDTKLYFNPNTTACESHWINLLNAHYNRFCFIDKRYHFRQKTNSTFLMDGGQTGRRTLETEKRDTLILKKYFGNSVGIKKEVNKTKQLHEYQRVLNIKL